LGIAAQLNEVQVGWLVVVVALPLGIWLWDRGVFKVNSFDKAPAGSDQRAVPADFMAGLFLWFFGQVLAASVTEAFWPGQLSAQGPLTERRVSLMVLHGLLMLLPLVVYFAARFRPPLSDWGPFRPGLAPRGLGESLPWAIRVLMAAMPFMFLSAMLALGVLQRFLDYPTPELGHSLLTPFLHDASLSLRLMLIGRVVILAPLVEELIFRGLFQSALVGMDGKKSRRWLAILVTSLMFAGIHFHSDPNVIGWHTLPPLFVLSIGLGWVYERTGSLWAPILVHALSNGLNIMIVWAGMVS
jgi:membrane protease YdiL (CAAX protease family)